MPGTRKWLLVAFLLAGCGAPFTSEAGDGGGAGDAGLVHPDASTDDASTNDGGDLGDSGSRRDAGGGEGDSGGVGGSDGGPVMRADAGPPCAILCPSGFACVLGQCVDDAETFYDAPANPPGNWATGWASGLGATLVPFTIDWSPPLGTLDFMSPTKNDIEPAFFRNPALTSQILLKNTEPDGSIAAEGMTVPAKSLGLHPGLGPTVSILRWTAPRAGVYVIDVTFTGLVYTDDSTPMASVNVFVDGATDGSGGAFLNAYNEPKNTSTYSAAKTVNLGSKVDFYVGYAQSSPGYAGTHAPGGVEIQARLTAR